MRFDQQVDPVVGMLAPSPPSTLYTIRGPIYVEPSSLQAYVQQGVAVAPQAPSPPSYYAPAPAPSPPVIGQAVLAPSPYNPYSQPWVMLDEHQDEVSAPSRRYNTNEQSGIQQIGQGNMNLQGNIQQINRRSSYPQQQQQVTSFISNLLINQIKETVLLRLT
jgi:hypothetical protein